MSSRKAERHTFFIFSLLTTVNYISLTVIM